MYKTLKLRKLSTGSVFKLVALGSICALVPVFTLMGLMSLFGAGNMRWNGQALTGLPSLLASPFIGLLFSLFVTAMVGGMLALGLWLYSLVRPLQLEYRTDDPPADGS